MGEEFKFDTGHIRTKVIYDEKNGDTYISIKIDTDPKTKRAKTFNKVVNLCLSIITFMERILKINTSK